MIVVLAVTLPLLLGALALVVLGLRAGDKPGDARLVAVTPEPELPAVNVSVTNPGDAPVLVGMVLRPPGVRLRLEGGHYVRVQTRRTARRQPPNRRARAFGLPTDQTTVGVLEPRTTGTFLVPGPGLSGMRAELVALLGQPGRLREIHRGLRLAPVGSTTADRGAGLKLAARS